jgi:hypothetical protein
MEKNMKNFLVWLMGEPTIKDLTWLFETPPDRSPSKGKTSDEMAIEHMTQLLESMRSEVAEIQNIIEEFRQTTNDSQHKCDLKHQCYQDLIAIALAAKQQGNMLEARIAMAKAVHTKRIIPVLTAMLNSCQERLISSHEIYAQKEADLAILELDLETIKIQSKMNDSIDGHRDLDKSRDLIALQERFRNAQSDIEHRYQEIQIASQLKNPSNCELGESMNIQDLDALIAELEGDDCD